MPGTDEENSSISGSEDDVGGRYVFIADKL